MSAADAQREAQIANGHWQSGWHDATGASGDSDLVIAIDGASRTAKATVSFGGELLGARCRPLLTTSTCCPWAIAWEMPNHIFRKAAFGGGEIAVGDGLVQATDHVAVRNSGHVHIVPRETCPHRPGPAGGRWTGEAQAGSARHLQPGRGH